MKQASSKVDAHASLIIRVQKGVVVDGQTATGPIRYQIIVEP